MATDKLKNSITSLGKQFEKEKDNKNGKINRAETFGNVLNEIEIDGFRGISNKITIKLDFPIVAISGLNGTGKSTVLQLALCAFNKLSNNLPGKANFRYYIKDFFPVSQLDSPISKHAKVKYTYQIQKDTKEQSVTVTRSEQGKKWSGYKRQPKKYCFYIGFLVYLPKIEKKDFTITLKTGYTILESAPLSVDIVTKMARIIGYQYDSISFEKVQNDNRQTELAKINKIGKSYTENNMGFGEGRVLYIVNLLENSPNQSFFVIEEPETGLHEEAQFRFTEYLIDVCIRKKHQIIISTHSRIITNTLPPEARKLLQNKDGNCLVIDNVSSCQISSALSQQAELVICVEDIFAKELLTEAIRKIDKTLLPSVSIHEFGDKSAVTSAVDAIRTIGKKAIAVRDADTGEDIKKGLFSFPVIGQQTKNKGNPPEKDVFSNDMVFHFFKNNFGVDIKWIIQRNNSDHHDFALHIGEEIKRSVEVVRTDAIEQYLSDKAVIDAYKDLVANIEESIADHKSYPLIKTK